MLPVLKRIELERLTEDNGFGLPRGETDGWHAFEALAVPHRLWVAWAAPHWQAGLTHPGVMAELLADTPAAPEPCPDGTPAVAVEELGPLIRRMLRLAKSLPDAPLDRFAAATRAMPRTTEAERLVVQRVGQDIFRDSLLAYWNGSCPLTGLGHPRLLRASHLKPWAQCASDAERLDVHNGLLLAAHLDAALDAGLVSFTDDGTILVSPALDEPDRQRLALATLPRLDGLRPAHLPFLAHHRDRVFNHGGFREQR